MDISSKSKDGVNAAIEKYKDHPSIKTTNDHLDLVSVLKTICKPDIQNKVSNLNSKKARTCVDSGKCYLFILEKKNKHLWAKIDSTVEK